MKKHTGQICTLAITAALLMPAPAHGAFPSDITGLWLTEGREGAVEIYRCGEGLCGKLAWLGPDEDKKSVEDLQDSRNHDPALRTRALCGLDFMGGFTPSPDGTLTDGWIYSPRHGVVFSAEIRPIDQNRIALHGYVLLPALGQSQVWTKTELPLSCKGGAKGQGMASQEKN